MTTAPQPREPNFVTTTVRMFSGVLVWAAHFLLIYGFTALACARDFAAAVPWGIAIATVAALMILLVVMRGAIRTAPEFVEWMTISVGAIAIVAMVFESLPMIWVPICGTR